MFYKNNFTLYSANPTNIICMDFRLYIVLLKTTLSIQLK